MPLILLLITIVFMPAALACTDFQIKSSDHTIITARSMEWGDEINSKLRICPRQEKHAGVTPSGQKGLSWQSKYGYVGVDCYGRDTVIDGINEKGLSVGGLWFPGAIYQQISPGQSEKTISALDLCAWMLGNFATVAEAKSALNSIVVWAEEEPEIKTIPTLHFALHDALGENAVIEFVDGQRKCYDNPNGVLTNAPSFDWHLTNLCNYLMVRPDNPEPVTIGDTVLAPPGQGGGFMGIPGDWTPASRFVRTTAMLRFAKTVPDKTQAIILAQHILNAVDIPLGSVRPDNGNIVHSDYTQWALIKDLTNKIFYYRSYDNMQLRSIDLKRIDFDHPPALNIPIASNQ
jgi:choloylglycine hydrolase